MCKFEVVWLKTILMRKLLPFFFIVCIVAELQAQTLYLPSGSAGIGALNASTNGTAPASTFVGIGTASPTAYLDIKSPNTSTQVLQLRLRPTGNGGVGPISPSITSSIDMWSTFNNVLDQAPRRTAIIKAQFSGGTGAWGAEALTFGVGYNGAANDAAAEPFEKMRILSNGFVGIGTTNPSELLEISGIGNTLLKISSINNPVSAKYKVGISFSTGGSIYQDVNRTWGNNAFYIAYDTKSISFWNDAINFGSIIPPGSTGGKFNFDNLVWANSIFVSDYKTPSPYNNYNMPDGFKFAVNGKTAFLDNVAIGATTIPTAKLQVTGDMAISDKVVIGNVSSSDATKPTLATDYKLYVEKGIITERVKCALKSTAKWADYVFAPEYKLQSLKEVEAYVQQHRHLPNVPSAEEVVENGVDMVTMDAKLLEKIEELTLHMIRLQKENDEIRKEMKVLKATK